VKRAAHVGGESAAVASALGRDTTFIWGPPGTGKTRTIGKIGEQLARQERSVLLVSHTNSAVDQAVLEIAHELGDDLVDCDVLRLGTPKDQRLAENKRLLAETHISEQVSALERPAQNGTPARSRTHVRMRSDPNWHLPRIDLQVPNKRGGKDGAETSIRRCDSRGLPVRVHRHRHSRQSGHVGPTGPEL